MQLPPLDRVHQDSPYLRQHRDGFRLLSFDGGMEAAFNRYHLSVFLVRMRWALLAGAVLIALFAVLDVLSLPAEVHKRTVAVRLGLMLPMLLIAWFSTYVRRMRPHLQLIGAGAALACGLGVDGIIWIARVWDFPLPYEGIILVTVFCYFLLGLRFVTAALCGWLTFFAYLAVEVTSGLPAEQLLPTRCSSAAPI